MEGLPDSLVLGQREVVKSAFVAHRALLSSANVQQLQQDKVTFTKASFFQSIPYVPCSRHALTLSQMSALLDNGHSALRLRCLALLVTTYRQLKGIQVKRLQLASCVVGRKDSHAIHDDMSVESRYGEPRSVDRWSVRANLSAVGRLAEVLCVCVQVRSANMCQRQDMLRRLSTCHWLLPSCTLRGISNCLHP